VLLQLVALPVHSSSTLDRPPVLAQALLAHCAYCSALAVGAVAVEVAATVRWSSTLG